MDVRHQVFVSSTYVDLMEERREVIQALLELDCIPAGMEMFPAASEEQWELIKSVIDSSDFYVVIVGGRYGSTTAEGLSYTEMEYDYAVEQGLPILGFVHADPGKIPRDKSEIDPSATERLESFRAKVKSRLVRTFNDPASLGSVLSRSLVAAIKKHDRPGWVRGEYAMTSETRAELAELRARIAELEQEAQDRVYEGTSADLAQGDDPTSLAYEYTSGSWSDERSWAGEWELSWNQILKVVGPLALTEATEASMRSRVETLVLEELLESGQVPQVDRARLALTDASWDAILIQLRALNLIQPGSKRRTVSDRSTYWAITALGDSQLVGLLARRR